MVEKTQSKEGHFTEFTAARIIKNILSAIQYCHDEKHIVHRDLVSTMFSLFHFDGYTLHTIDSRVHSFDHLRVHSFTHTYIHLLMKRNRRIFFLQIRRMMHKLRLLILGK